MYARGQLYGQTIETTTDTLLFILHTNDIEDYDIMLWSGETAGFKPVPNSGILIESGTEYKSIGPSRLVSDLKVTVVWEFI